MGAAIAISVLYINYGSRGSLEAWADKYPTYLLLTALLYALAVFTVGAALGRLWLGGALTGMAALTVSMVDYFKTAINGTPLTLADFGLATQLGEVAGVAGDLTPPRQFWKALALVLLCVAALLILQRLTVLKGRARFLSAALALNLLIGVLSPSCSAWIGSVFSVDVYARMPAATNNNQYGLTLALWRDSVMQTTPEPTGYSERYMRQVLERVDELLEQKTSGEDGTARPNVIMVLSEAFFDMTRLPDLTWERDPLEHYHMLEEESVSGAFFTHYLGYGTGYIEMAMQYGVDSHDFGSSTNICFLEDKQYELFDALPEQFTRQGDYRAEMLHAYNDSLYNRTVTYPMLGYEQLYFSSDMQELGFEWSGGPYGGYYLKDAYTYRAALERMQAINEEGERAFLFVITMENHQPFDPEKFDGVCQIGTESSVLDDGDMAIARVMVEGITRADQALGELTEALRQSDEPTVLVFFGDHRPNLFLTNGDTIYTRYGLSPSNDTSAWTAEQVAELYSTDYLIWANDAALLGAQAGTRQDSSITAIGPKLLELLGAETSRYWGLLGLVSDEILMDHELYFVDSESRVFPSAEAAGLTEFQRELLELRQAVIYDAFYGQQYITAEMNLPAGT